MELRDIEIFLALAEELHFGRTAAKLYVSAARVSQAIKKQEREIGTELFSRDSRNVVLTPAGERLRQDLVPIYRGLQQTMERARLAAAGKTDVLRVGLIPGNAFELRRYWDAFRARHPHWDLRLRHAPVSDPFGGLRRGDVDVLVCWLPVEEPDLVVGPLLFAEPRVLAVAVDHELADRESATIEMLADFPVSMSKPVPDYWDDSYTPPHTPKGHTITRVSHTETIDDIFMRVSTGEIVSTFPAHVARYWPRPDVIYLPVTDMDKLRFGLVWREETENNLIRAFAKIVRELGSL